MRLPATTTRDQSFRLSGGLDIVSALSSLPPGFLRDAVNVECISPSGYRRMSGYERFDGRTAPSDAVASTLTVNVTGTISVSDTITGATSGATGKVIYRSGDLVVYTRATGAFVDAEDLKVGVPVQGTITALSGSDGTDDYDVRMKYLAAEEYKASIGQVPGSGPVRAVFDIDGVWYACRDNAGATALAIYKDSPTGWTNVPLLWSVGFNTGTNDYVEGDTITQGGNSATVKRVVLETGTWAGGTAAGRLIITQPTPGAFAAGASAGGGVANLTGASAQITLQPGGTFDVDYESVAVERRIYAVDGKNPAWEFDGAVLAPIRVGYAPEHVMVHQGKLFLSLGNNVEYSETGTPWAWVVANGAGAMVAAGQVTQMKRLGGDQSTGAALIATDVTAQVLYGTGASSFSLRSFEDSAGAKSMSVQNMGDTLMFDVSGLIGLSSTTRFGNYSSLNLSQRIEPWLRTKKDIVVGSALRRDRSQYRLFFEDGTALYATFNGRKLVGLTPMTLLHTPSFIWRGRSFDGYESVKFGSASDGYVYEMDKGTSFDGSAIDWAMTLIYNDQGALRTIKRYRHAVFEFECDTYFEFSLQHDLAFGSSERAQGDIQSLAMNTTPMVWDEFTWDEFTWDGQGLEPAYASFDGSGENIALHIFGSSAKFADGKFNAVTLDFSPRRHIRGRVR